MAAQILRACRHCLLDSDLAYIVAFPEPQWPIIGAGYLYGYLQVLDGPDRQGGIVRHLNDEHLPDQVVTGQGGGDATLVTGDGSAGAVQRAVLVQVVGPGNAGVAGLRQAQATIAAINKAAGRQGTGGAGGQPGLVIGQGDPVAADAAAFVRIPDADAAPGLAVRVGVALAPFLHGQVAQQEALVICQQRRVIGAGEGDAQLGNAGVAVGILYLEGEVVNSPDPLGQDMGRVIGSIAPVAIALHDQLAKTAGHLAGGSDGAGGDSGDIASDEYGLGLVIRPLGGGFTGGCVYVEVVIGIAAHHQAGAQGGGQHIARHHRVVLADAGGAGCRQGGQLDDHGGGLAAVGPGGQGRVTLAGVHQLVGEGDALADTGLEANERQHPRIQVRPGYAVAIAGDMGRGELLPVREEGMCQVGQGGDEQVVQAVPVRIAEAEVRRAEAEIPRAKAKLGTGELMDRQGSGLGELAAGEVVVLATFGAASRIPATPANDDGMAGHRAYLVAGISQDADPDAAVATAAGMADHQQGAAPGG